MTVEIFLKTVRVILLSTLIIVAVVALWCGLSWVLGWAAHRMYGWDQFSYVGFGSKVLVFTLSAQILTVVATCMAMIAWGRSKGLLKGRKE